jgi:hypothetical protein
MLNHVNLYPEGSREGILPAVLSKALGEPKEPIEKILLEHMPKDRKGLYTFSGKAFKGSWKELSSITGKSFEDISSLCFTQYGPSAPRRKMTLGTFISKFAHGNYIIMLENGFTLMVKEGVIHANQEIASKPKSRIFRAYKIIS